MKYNTHCLLENSFYCRARHIPLTDGQGHVKLPITQVHMSNVSFYILYKEIENGIILEVGEVKNVYTSSAGKQKSSCSCTMYPMKYALHYII